MEPLEKQLMMRDAERFGFQLMSPADDLPAKLLQRMVESDDGRVLEGFPVVLTNMLMQHSNLNLLETEKELPSSLQRRFRMLACVTYIFFFWVPTGEDARKHLYKYLKEREPSLIASVKDKLEARSVLNVGAGVSLDVERLENTFRNYVVHQFMETKASLAKKVEDSRDKALLEALAELFTDKQRSLIIKTLAHESLTKTEREYYSRVVRPRLKALRNPDLQALVSNLLS
jgi:hypothetical protein